MTSQHRATRQAGADSGPAGPLAGLRVLDLSRVLAGPVCCQLLADLGADVVKVERPGSGDDTRSWGPPFAGAGGPSAYYLSANRGKRSLALDLGQAAGREVLDDLLRAADAMVENFLPDTSRRLGLQPQRLATLNPRLVSCAISGYGRSGPLAEAPGYDLAIQASSGLMSITGQPEGVPTKVGVAISDVVSGLYAAVSIVAGLLAVHRGRPATNCDLALLDATLASLVNVAQNALVTGARPPRYGNAHPSIVPYELFAAADRHLVLAVGNDGQWQRFCRAVARDYWAADPRFATNPLRVAHRQLLVPQIAELFAERPLAEWQALLAAAEVPHAPVLDVAEALRHPQAAARGMVEPAELHDGRRVELVASPLCGLAVGGRRPPPALGEHSREVLADWLGYAPGRIAQLAAAGVIAEAVARAAADR